MIFLIDTEFDLKITLRILNPENNIVIFKIVFSIHINSQYQSKIIRVIELKNKRIKD